MFQRKPKWGGKITFVDPKTLLSYSGELYKWADVKPRGWIRFQSKQEAYRYCDLVLLERAGKISHLSFQPRFDVVINGRKIFRYHADFLYVDGGKQIVEDVKGKQTREFRRTWLIMQALYDYKYVFRLYPEPVKKKRSRFKVAA